MENFMETMMGLLPKEYDNNMIYGFFIVGVVLATMIPLVVNICIDMKIRSSIKDQKFIEWSEFEENWIRGSKGRGRSGFTGYKYNDGSGCYVIVIFKKRVKNGNYKKRFENIYIGQSINICKRVHNHFNGKGNGDVYADIKYGKFVYVQFVPCKENKMNKIERKLIRAFRATDYYNKTKGGGMKRKR